MSSGQMVQLGAQVDLRAALQSMLGTKRASRFSDKELEGLAGQGYTTVDDLAAASWDGLKEAGVLAANADCILKVNRDAAAAKAAAAVAAAAGEGFQVEFSHGKNVQGDLFSSAPSYTQLVERVEVLFTQFQIEAFQLKHGNLVITADNWAALRSKISSPYKVQVVSTRKAFSGVTTQEGLQLLRVTSVSDVSEQEGANPFPDEVLPDDAALPRVVQQRTGLQTAGQFMQHIGMELAVRCCATHAQDIPNEAGRREFISPALTGSALLAGDVQLHAESPVAGVQAHGSVDWVLNFRGFNIVVVEAKQDGPPFNSYVGQVAAEMKSSRDAFALSRLGKGKREVDHAMDEVASYGILTDGFRYKFFKYEPSSRRLLSAESTAVLLPADCTALSAAEKVRPVVARLVHILKAQKADLLSFLEKHKKQRSDGS